MKLFLRNTVAAILAWETRMVLLKYKPRIIVVGGSVGKTSTKDAIFTVIEKTLIARKSAKSFNSEIGVPLTVLGCDNAWSNPLLWIKNILKGALLLVTREHYPKWLVLEVGVGKPGDIKKTMQNIIPDVVVLTRFGSVPVHVEFFKSPAEVFEEKMQMVKALKSSGMLIVNADDEKILAAREKTKAKSITYGLAKEAMFRGTNVKTVYKNGQPIGTTFKLEYDGNVFPVLISGALGVQQVYSSLAALAVGAYLKQNIVDMTLALSEHENPPGRMKIIQGIKETTIIDDSYNSSPIAAEVALDVLKKIKTKGKKIVVLGDMLELGKFALEEHRKLGAQAGGIADYVLVVGPRAKYLAEGALSKDMSEKNIIEFDDAKAAGKYLEGVLGSGDIVLVKGSQSMRMERAVLEIMAHPEDAETLLVRQEEEWMAKE
ncbi:MAG: Mur ligase family protein [Patescibacteria group bacterium]